jgi:thiamine biosynthesis protein ThiS
VAQLLVTLKIVPERVVVEVNLTILKRAELVSTILKDGDEVEIVHFVGGGSRWRKI